MTEHPMHLTTSLNGHGAHPAAWRVASLRAAPGRAPDYRPLARQADAGLLDAIFFGPSGATPAYTLSGAADTIQLDPMPLIGSLIGATSHIGLGASVYLRHTEPFHTARAFAVMDRFSGGRTAWLVDTEGTDQQEADFGHGKPLTEAEHYERAAEYIDVVTKLWGSWREDALRADKETGWFADSSRINPINHVGSHFSVRGPLVAMQPRQGWPVIVMRDASPAGQRLAAGKADVFLASAATIEEARALSGGLRQQAEAAGRAGELRILMNVMPILGSSAAEAERRSAALDVEITPELARALAALPKGVAPCRFVGSVDGFCDRLAEWHAAGVCDGFNILPPVLSDDLALLTSRVVPELQRRGLFPAKPPAGTLRERLGLKRPQVAVAA